MKSSVFWDMTPCSSLNVNRRFGEETCRYASYLLHAGFMFGLFIEPEDGGNMFHKNVG
jgi:hypothetical protein